MTRVRILILQLEELQLGLNERQELLQPFMGIHYVKKLLLVGELEIQMGRQCVGKLAGLNNPSYGTDHLLGNAFGQLHIPFKHRFCAPD